MDSNWIQYWETRHTYDKVFHSMKHTTTFKPKTQYNSETHHKNTHKSGILQILCTGWPKKATHSILWLKSVQELQNIHNWAHRTNDGRLLQKETFSKSLRQEDRFYKVETWAIINPPSLPWFNLLPTDSAEKNILWQDLIIKRKDTQFK